MELTPLDVQYYEMMRFLSILKDVEGHRLDRSRGVILVTCSDGDRFNDLFTQEANHVANQCEDRRIHVFAWNGGALRLAPNSPVNKAGRTTDEDGIDDIKDAMVMKNISTVALYAHGPCGKAYAHKLNLLEVVQLLIAAKKRLKEQIPGAAVACFIHLHHTDGRDRSYFLSRSDFEAHPVIRPWVASN